MQRIHHDSIYRTEQDELLNTKENGFINGSLKTVTKYRTNIYKFLAFVCNSSQIYTETVGQQSIFTTTYTTFHACSQAPPSLVQPEKKEKSTPKRCFI